MSTLVMLGSSAAFFYSLAVLLVPGVFPVGTAPTYFEASASVVTLILVGKHLEGLAKGRTSSAIRKLLSLQAKVARVVRGDETVEVAIDDVVVGDVVAVRPGERVPVDGVVLEGAPFLDESMVTGEPMPVLRAVGAKAVGGTVNTVSAFTRRATRVGRETTLAQIVRAVEQAQGSKPATQVFADRVAEVFVPVIVGLALVAAVSVLVIACACAMGLATPTTVMVATGRAAELGALFRKGAALERLASANAVFLDKTGTLTEGRPVLTDLHVLSGAHDRVAVLRWVGAVETRSEHPVARAIVAAAAASTPTLPAGKADAVRTLQARGKRAAFVGDGINDAPALAQADVGVAVATGTDVGIEAGDVVLLHDDLRAFVAAVRLARRSLRVIRQNLFWAYAYNVAFGESATARELARLGLGALRLSVPRR